MREKKIIQKHPNGRWDTAIAKKNKLYKSWKKTTHAEKQAARKADGRNESE